MRVTYNSVFGDASQSVTQAAQALSDAQKQVMSAKRINTPSDDPLGSMLAIGEHAVIARTDAYTQVSDATTSRLNIADSVLTDMVNQLTAAQSSALGGRGSDKTVAQRQASAGDIRSIRDALLGDISTTFQGAYVFSGSKNVAPVGRVPTTGTPPPVVFTPYLGNDTPSAVDVGSGRTVAISFDGGRILNDPDPSAPTDRTKALNMLNQLTALADAVERGDDAAIGTGIDAVKRAFDRAVSVQTSIGNDLHSAEDGRAALQTAKLGATTRVSQLEDANMPEAISKMSAADTAYRAALAAYASLGKVSLMDYVR